MSVKDVHAKANQLEAKLTGKPFLGGSAPSAEDVKAFNDLLGEKHGAIYRWVKHIASYSEAERKAWGAPVKVTAPVAVPTPAAAPAKEEKKAAAHSHAHHAPAHKPHEEGHKAHAHPHAHAHDEHHKAPAAHKPAAAPAPAPADDDDVDLFGETTEEEKAALEAKKAKDAEGKKAKKAVIAKSSILYDIKGWDDTTDLEGLAKKIKAIHRDGLTWGEHKLVPVAFGLNKLQLLLVIEDDKVSGDDLEELIMGFEDEVQSIDIVAWNKI